jgi:hypothetical protein
MERCEFPGSNPIHPDEGAKPSLAELSTPRLLEHYGEILTILRARGITRTEDSPVGGYAEHLAARAFDLNLTGNSSSGYDDVDEAGIRYQVKGRRITRWNVSRQLSAIRGLGEGNPDPFDQLIGILFNGDFTILRAAMVPLGVVRSQARLQAHVNGWAVHADRRHLDPAGRSGRDRGDRSSVPV